MAVYVQCDKPRFKDGLICLFGRESNTFRGDHLRREIDEELQSHMEEAIADGRDPVEIRRAFGNRLRHAEQSRDLRLIVWLDSLAADLIFGWRQLAKRPAASTAAVLSLALAIGACTSAFRLIDALLLRPMLVGHADRLYAMVLHGAGPDGSIRDSDSNEYPQFRIMRAAVKDQAELIAASWVDRSDLTYSSDQEMERAHRQYVSGWMFGAFGLKPAVGRLFIESDDLKPQTHAYAVLSYDYWASRFGRDQKVIGRRFQMGIVQYEIIGVAPEGFTGTEPGTFTDIFLPTMMHEGVTHEDWSWFRTFIQLKPGANADGVRNRLQAIWNVLQRERAKSFTSWPEERVKKYLAQRVLVLPAAAGRSDMRKSYETALIALAVIVSLVLLIACANVANLLTAQAIGRSREMALRVSIGAGKGRLVQLVLMESWLLAGLATFVGVLFAWWSAPFIVARINSPDNPARLVLPADWRVVLFATGLGLAVTVLFGLPPALRASAVNPASALKGGDDPHVRRRLMHALIAAQVAFCFLVHFAAGAFVATLSRMANQPTGFSSERLLVVDTVARQPQSADVWYQAAAQLRELSGIENVALSGWPLMSGAGQNGFVSVNGAPPHPLLASFLPVSPGWFETMKIPLLEGREFRLADVTPNDEATVGAAIVNRAFAKEYFGDIDPVGKSFERRNQHFKIVGLVRDARYHDMREPITATGYLPLRYPAPESLGSATFMILTTSPNPLVMAPTMRREMKRARSEFRVSNIRTQSELNESQTVRERLLAMLAVFFAGVAVLLAGIGLYGVLDYSVLQRRREFGIRMAVGAPIGDIARRVTDDVFLMVLVGSGIGAASGLFLERYVRTLLYEVRPFDLAVLAPPAMIIVAAAILAAIPAIIRAIRIDAAMMLRAD